jgi:hypothetical protein
MASRQFTVDPAKKKKFLNFILQMPKLRVPDAMKLAMFSNEDIADLGLRHFLQRALPGGTVKAMKVQLGAFFLPEPPPPSHQDQCQKRLVNELVAASSKAATKPVDDLLSTKIDQLVAAATESATSCQPRVIGGRLRRRRQ